MLHELSISSLGVIADARLTLGDGLTVVTGETGAGKTMILTGLNLILGGKPSMKSSAQSVKAKPRYGTP